MEIDVTKISKEEGRKIGMRFKNLMDKFYSNPENEEKFQEWLKTKQDMKKNNA